MAGQQTTLDMSRTHVHDWSPVKQDGDHKSSREIEQDIENLRHEMDSTMDYLGDRLHPRHLLDFFFDFFNQAKDREHIREAAQDMGRRAVDVVRDNPFPAMLIGAGIGWITWNMQQHHHHGSGIQPGYRDRGRMADTTGKAKSAVASAQGAINQAYEKSKEGMQSATDWTREQAQGIHAGMEQTQQRLSYGYEKSSSAVRDMIQEHPLALGVVAIAAGIITGLSLPSTKTEDRFVGTASSEAKDKAASAVGNTVESAKEAGKETIAAVREQAREEGVTPDQVRSKTEREGFSPEQFAEKAKRVSETAVQKAKEEAERRTKNNNNQRI